MTPTTGGAARPWWRHLVTGIKLAFMAAVVLAGVVWVSGQWDEVSEAVDAIAPWLLVLALVSVRGRAPHVDGVVARRLAGLSGSGSRRAAVRGCSS
ncbi:hypothetical protein [Curtobacterium flaccumfaciens]|uniref:hypothetical protein n=1 Tax=Curtobacterium flaccumfaciens TaxID=2035 RepID=UPI00217D6A43|nr:hypothetical protein [Curtobacterium flaccumfaciens]MCS6529421.1 hypothetical protein [Curtobacterium flaccumfaciens pv. flaccumfaciens]